MAGLFVCSQLNARFDVANSGWTRAARRIFDVVGVLARDFSSVL
jgi:hypothetical protein